MSRLDELARELRRPVPAGSSVLRIEARVPGKIPAVHELKIEGLYPATPLYLDTPGDKPVIRTQDTLLPIAGRTDPDAMVFLGRIPIEVGADGRFAYSLRLDEGLNDVRLVAELRGIPGRLDRPPTARAWEVECEPPGRRRVQRVDLGEQAPIALSEVVGAPWDHLDRRVRFPMRLDRYERNPHEEGCRSRMIGHACALEVTRSARVGFEEVEARACVGDRTPVLVEAEFCPEDAEAGRWVEVLGRVRGAVAGREGDHTVQQLRIEGEEARPAPRVKGRD